MPTECKHEKAAVVASAARLVLSGGRVRVGLLEWCTQCGAIRPSAPEVEGHWLTPNSVGSAVRFDNLQAQQREVPSSVLEVRDGE